MNLRWYIDDEGERTLQIETHYGWTAVEEVHASQERCNIRRRIEERSLSYSRAAERQRRLEEVRRADLVRRIFPE
jgi:hypothetical protein